MKRPQPSSLSLTLHPLAAQTLHAALGGADYPRASSPSGSLGSSHTIAAHEPAASPSGADGPSHFAKAPAATAASSLPRNSSFVDLDLDHLISVPNCPVAESCKLEPLEPSACEGSLFGMVPDAGRARGGAARGAAAGARALNVAGGAGVRKQSARLREKGMASLAVQDAIEAVGDYLELEEPADWEAMLFPMALDSEPY
jgi:hypothetical protein